MTLYVSSLRCSAGQTTLLSSVISRAGVSIPRCSAKPLQGARSRRSRAPLEIRANELNKWANRDGFDDPHGLPDDGFDRDTAGVVLRVLTARSVQVLLMQLQECDVFVAQYLNNFAAENPPSQEKFLPKLFAQSGKTVRDPGTGALHNIDPQALAHRILQTREEMAKNVMSGFQAYVSQENTDVMRSYLTNSYTSGSTEEGYKERRGYYRPKKDPKR